MKETKLTNLPEHLANLPEDAINQYDPILDKLPTPYPQKLVMYVMSSIHPNKYMKYDVVLTTPPPTRN